MKPIQAILFILILALSRLVMAQPQSIDGLIIKPSAYSVPETLDRLEQILLKKGLTIFTRVNHTKGAKKVGLTMTETELFFGGITKRSSK